MTKVRYIGLDVRKDSITIATAEAGHDPARKFKTIPNDGTRLLKTRRLRTPGGGRLLVCYEAGPIGYGLYRRLRDDAKRAERTARHRLGKFLLRHDRRWGGRANWTKQHSPP